MERIIVTGGTGFLGKRLGKRLQELGHQVLLAGRNNKQNLQAREYTGCETLAMDVSNIESVRDIVTQFGPTVIIHAAATKFVDISERQPMEAVDINVVGSQNIARVATEKGVKLVLGISTDKAAPPITSTYGLTKALMERMFCSMDGKNKTSFMCVRYGNVAWSTGSVLGVWERMLRNKGVIETTGPDMLRFFFTVDQAMELVLTALEHADELHGKVLARHMKAVKMEDILKVWTTQEGARYVRIEGRPGDREQEVLVGEQELPFTRQRQYNGITHYIISFNQRVDDPVHQILSSANTERLTDEEIRVLINNPPTEESRP